jgi:hypothetical protein
LLSNFSVSSEVDIITIASFAYIFSNWHIDMAVSLPPVPVSGTPGFKSQSFLLDRLSLSLVFGKLLALPLCKLDFVGGKSTRVR